MKGGDTSVLLIYTGGTIGMMHDPVSGSYVPYNFSNILREVPELKRFGFRIESVEFENPVDSSDMTPALWLKIAEIIERNYTGFDGFVILHGTDTMAYTASALSFILESLSKPVVLTGSQLPINILRTDGRENLITSIEIAAAKIGGRPAVPEVCIYFEYKLYRGNRTRKRSAELFNAFESPGYPQLAEAGVTIKFNPAAILTAPETAGSLKLNARVDTNVAVLKLFPGISADVVRAISSVPGLRAIVIESFGSGNSPSDPELIEAVSLCTGRGILAVNVTQCSSGRVEMERYSSGTHLKGAGVLSGYDITTEAAVTKLMVLLGKYSDNETVKKEFVKNLAGEITL